MKVVLMAGGKGTRIASIAKDIPKPMIRINDIPVLEHELLCMKRQGFTDFIITVGHLSGVIMEYFGNGRKLGVDIEYFVEEEPLGNAGALFRIKDKLTDDFLLLNADAMFDIDFNRFVDYHIKKGAMVTIFTHPNGHPYDSGLIFANEKGQVEKWLSKEDERPEFYQNRVNAGLHVLSKRLLNTSVVSVKVDLDRQLLKPLAGTGKMYVYDSPEYVKDMGTPDRYHSVCKDFLNGMLWKRNLNNPQKAIFLDRDGTINQYVGFLKNVDDFVLIDGVSDAIRKINNSEYLAIVVTNQPVIARGEVSKRELKNIHNKMETLLGKEGSYVNAVYYCPHHPDRGFEGERIEYKFDCECRKLKPGMLLRAAEDFNIDLSESWMIGDSENDILAGKNAGCRTVLVSTEDKKYGQDILCATLSEAVDEVLSLS